MLTIYKYSVSPSVEVQEIESYEGAIPLSCGIDPNGKLCIWVMVETEAPAASLKVYCVGTGWPLNEVLEDNANVDYLGVIVHAPYVWHVLVEKE